MWNWKSVAPAAILGMTLSMAAGAQTTAKPAEAPVTVAHAWARASVQGQQATGAFMQLTAHEHVRLVGVETPVAASGEVHEMRMDGDVMRMRQIESLDLPKGETVALKPGGHHLMFMQLNTPLQEGTQVPVTLKFQDTQGTESQLSLQLPVKRMAPAAPSAHGMPHAAPSHGH